jgi:hypothetical protein
LRIEKITSKSYRKLLIDGEVGGKKENGAGNNPLL